VSTENGADYEKEVQERLLDTLIDLVVERAAGDDGLFAATRAALAEAAAEAVLTRLSANWLQQVEPLIAAFETRLFQIRFDPAAARASLADEIAERVASRLPHGMQREFLGEIRSRFAEIEQRLQTRIDGLRVPNTRPAPSRPWSGMATGLLLGACLFGAGIRVGQIWGSSVSAPAGSAFEPAVSSGPIPNADRPALPAQAGTAPRERR
jgi:hypothetical protein